MKTKFWITFLIGLFILADLLILSARNLALRGVRLDMDEAKNLQWFNEMGLGFLAGAGVLWMVLIFWKKKQREDRWPLDPPKRK